MRQAAGVQSRLENSVKDIRRFLGGMTGQGDLRVGDSSPGEQGHGQGCSKTRAVQGCGRSAREQGRGPHGYFQGDEALGMPWRGESQWVTQASRCS